MKVARVYVPTQVYCTGVQGYRNIIRVHIPSMVLFYILHYFIKLAVYTLQDCFNVFLLLTPPLLALFLRRQLPSISCILFDVLLVSNGVLGTHDRNIAPCGIICRGAMGATVFWVCRKWNNREWWGWFVLLFYLTFEEF